VNLVERELYCCLPVALADLALLSLIFRISHEKATNKLVASAGRCNGAGVAPAHGMGKALSEAGGM